jgi:Reverse transcriptase (RNA-dependent DNA polymerase)
MPRLATPPTSPPSNPPSSPPPIQHLDTYLSSLQLSRCWFQKLKQFLLAHNFKPSQVDHSLFVSYSFKDILHILIYVDDIIITDNNTSAIHELIQALTTQFSIKDLGSLAYFLGIELKLIVGSFHLTQISYLQSILKKASM